MSIDPKAIILVIVPVNLLLTGLAVLFLRGTESRSIVSWYSGLIALTLFFALLALRDTIPDWMSYQLAHFFLALATVMFIASQRIELNLKPAPVLYCLIVVAYVLIFWLLLAYAPVSARLFFIGLFMLVCYAWLVWNAIKISRQHESKGGMLSAVGFSFAVLYGVVNVVATLTGTGSALSSTWENYVMAFAFLMGPMFINFGYFGYALERQGQRRLEELRISELKHQLQFESSRDALMTLAPPDWGFTSANQAALQLFGAATQGEFIALGPWNVSPERQPDGRLSGEKAQEAITIAMRDGTYSFEWEHQRLDGKPFPADVLLTRMKLGDEVFLQASVRDISARKQAEQVLRESEELFRQMFERHSAVMLLTEPESGEVVDANQAAAQFYGYPLEQLIGMNIARINILSAEQVAESMHQALDGANNSFEFGHRLAGGDVRTVEVHTTPIHFKGRTLLFSIIHDISERKLFEKDLSIAATAFESREGIMITDANSQILRVNSAFTEITGYTAEDVIGKNPRILSSGLQGAGFYKAMWAAIKVRGVWEGEVINCRKNGEVYPEHLNIFAVTDAGGNVTNYVATLADISERKSAEDAIKNLAFYDPLTGLPNRRLLHDRLRQALAGSARNGLQGALLFMDMDHFKKINDTLGHEMGDALLKEVAARLATCVREDDTIARLGGDEFVVMLENLSKDSRDAALQARAVGEKILSALGQPYQLGVHERRSSASIGITLFNDHQATKEDLIKQADIAMYQSKKAGRNTLYFFDPGMQEAINTREILEHRLIKAIDDHQFILYYQIQVDSDNCPIGAEALIRWFHPEQGLISPAQFIPLAEETKLIVPIGQWVLDTACAQLEDWQHNALTHALVLSVNISAQQFRQPDFVEQVQAAMSRHDVKPSLLKLELTESLLLDDVDGTIATMNALKEIGVQFSLDDFGTGYSSLQYLKQLPLNQLKIDQSFVRDIASDSSDRAIVNTIIAMAHSLKLDVIAEGVETEEQQKLLLGMGCVYYQGYFFGRPMPLLQFEQELTST